MKLIKISNSSDNYINVDFLLRLWIEDNYYYCELINGKYKISKDAYVKILEYVKTRV